VRRYGCIALSGWHLSRQSGADEIRVCRRCECLFGSCQRANYHYNKWLGYKRRFSRLLGCKRNLQQNSRLCGRVGCTGASAAELEIFFHHNQTHWKSLLGWDRDWRECGWWWAWRLDCTRGSGTPGIEYQLHRWRLTVYATGNRTLPDSLTLPAEGWTCFYKDESNDLGVEVLLYNFHWLSRQRLFWVQVVLFDDFASTVNFLTGTVGLVPYLRLGRAIRLLPGW